MLVTHDMGVIAETADRVAVMYAGRLVEIARVLGVPVGYCYEGVGEEGMRSLPQRERMVLEITRNFADITDERHQQALIALTRALASTH